MILGFYLAIKPWTLDFRACEESFGSTLVWFRIRGLNITYYHEKAFMLIASAIGVPFKVDLTTARGRFARACVQIDLGVPVEKMICVDGVNYEVEYETVDMICNYCSCFGHKADECVSKKERMDHNSWRRPQEGFVKVNCDGSVFPDLGVAGFGCVIRDSSGTWLKGTSGRVRGINVLRTELFGIWRGLVKAWEAGFRLVECETDCVEAFNLVQLCQCHLVSMHNERWILEKILEFKQRNWTIKFSWVQRNANRVADYPAKQGAKTHLDCVDWSVPNEHLPHLLQRDLLQ